MCSKNAIFWALASLIAQCTADDGGALVIPPSQFFEGNDGPWSTFDIRVGDPEQYIRVLVSTAAPQSMVVLDSDGCSEAVFTTVPSDCAVSRGNLFNINESSTWTDVGLHAINGDGVGLEANLGYSQRAQFGLEKLGLGLNGPSFENQTVAGIATAEPFYLGILGLNGQPYNFTTLGNSSAPSLLTTLKDQNKIPSLSWSYTAGARYRLKQVYGQLIFSGYDAARFEENSASFTMAGDVTRDLVVVLQSISYSGSTTSQLLSDPIDIYIDSTDANLWLPQATCDAFEEAFGLTLDEDSGLYLVNDSHHETLLDSDAQVTFRISDVEGGGETVTVRLPYAAFDLVAENPLVNGSESSRYFPLKRAANATQYTLGRTFLQEAYLSADYERKVFNVSACVWQEGAEEDIVTIPSRDGNTGSGGNGNGNSDDNSSNRLSTGAIAGIAVGSVIAGLLLIAAVAFLILRQRRKWIGAGFAVADTSNRKHQGRHNRRDSVVDGPVFNAGPSSSSPSPRSLGSGMPVMGMANATTPWNADDVSRLSKSDPSADNSRSTSGAANNNGNNTGTTTSSSGAASSGLLVPSSSSGNNTGTNDTTPELGGTEIIGAGGGGGGGGPRVGSAAAGVAGSSALPAVSEDHGLYELPGTEMLRSKSGKLRIVEDFSISGVPETSEQGGSGVGGGICRSRFGDVSPISTRLVPKLDTTMARDGEDRRRSSLVSPATP